METAGEDGETRGLLILAYVPALEPTRPVHRREPTAHPTEAPDDGPNPPEERLPYPSRALPEILQHPADAPPVLHFLSGNRENLRGLRRIRERSRVASIREGGSELARVRPSKNGNQLTKRAILNAVHGDLRRPRFFDKPFPPASLCGTLVHTYADTDDR